VARGHGGGDGKEGKRVSSLDGLDSRQQRANYRQRFGGLKVNAAVKMLKWLDMEVLPIEDDDRQLEVMAANQWSC
jgi:hypothetical protein